MAVYAIVLEVTTSGFNSIESKIRRICTGLQIGSEYVHVFHTRARDDFETRVRRREEKQESALLILCDIEEGQGESARDLRKYIDKVWSTLPPAWISNQPVIIYSHDDITYSRMKRAQEHAARDASDVISQAPVVGLSPRDELRNALTRAIRKVHLAPGGQVQ